MTDRRGAAGGSLLKILCLHGYRQNAQLFREKTGSFRKAVKKYADLVYISAPNLVPPTAGDGEDEDADGGDRRGWWFSDEHNSYKPADPTDCCKGYKESLDVIIKTFQQEGPFDGVMGFSQGASMVSLLCGLRENGDVSSPIKFGFAIIIAGFKSRSSPHNCLYAKKITIPTLHVYGITDRVIPKEMSEDLLVYFEHPQSVEHEGGHFVPVSSHQKRLYLDFLDTRHKKRFENT